MLPRGLRRDIARNVAPAHPTLARIGERDGRVEMSAGNGPEGENERHERCARRPRVREQRDGHVAAAEAFAHDARANDRSQK